ncbi:MAG: hypothetical protein RDU89_11350 [bacterium]|nr:hypothetical protein [bacterium]
MVGRPQERGSVFVITLLVAMLGVLALAAASALTGDSARAAARWRDEGAALYIAESGINEGLYRLKYNRADVEERVYPRDPPSFTSQPGLVGLQASYQVWVWDDESDPGAKHVVAIGARNSVRRLVRVRARPLHPNPFAGPGPGGGDGPGDGGGGGGSGDGGDSGGGGDAPVVYPPPGLECRGLLHLTGNRTYYLGNSDGSRATLLYSGIIADGQARLVLLSPVSLWVTGDISLSGGSKLNVVEEGGKWVGGDPLDLLVWVPGQLTIEIDLSGNTRFYGGIYAPRSDIAIAGTADMEGGMVTGSVIVTGDGTLDEVYSYYDPMDDIPWPDSAHLDYGPIAYD